MGIIVWELLPYTQIIYNILKKFIHFGYSRLPVTFSDKEYDGIIWFYLCIY